MKNNKKATSIIEAMIIMLIIVSGVVGMFKVFNESQNLSNSTNNKIQAIQIAREGIEAMKNIRDTNWILYGSDTQNCWNTFNYNNDCVGQPVATYTLTDIKNDGVYKIFQDPSNKRWNLEEKITSETLFSESNYRSEMQIGYDSNGFYTQSGTLIADTLKPLFTREIRTKYIDTNGGSADSNDEKMEITSLVQWSDSASTQPHRVEFTTDITNWKK